MLRSWRVPLFSALCIGVLSACQVSGPMSAAQAEPDLVVIGEHTPSLAPAVLTVPETIELISIDGKRTPLNLKQRYLKLALTPGQHRLELRYFNLWDVDADEHDIVKSRPVLLNVDVKSGRQYEFEALPAFETPAQARDFVQNFAPKIITFKPAVMVVTQAGVADKQKRADVQRAAATEVVSEAIAPGAPLYVSQPAGHTNQKPGSAVSESSLEVVQRLWLELSPAERDAFQKWIGDGPAK